MEGGEILSWFVEVVGVGVGMNGRGWWRRSWRVADQEEAGQSRSRLQHTAQSASERVRTGTWASAGRAGSGTGVVRVQVRVGGARAGTGTATGVRVAGTGTGYRHRLQAPAYRPPATGHRLQAPGHRRRLQAPVQGWSRRQAVWRGGGAQRPRRAPHPCRPRAPQRQRGRPDGRAEPPQGCPVLLSRPVPAASEAPGGGGCPRWQAECR